MPRTRGPALIYVTSTGRQVPVDTEAVADARERAIYRALAGRADKLADQADDSTAPPAGTGQYL